MFRNYFSLSYFLLGKLSDFSGFWVGWESEQLLQCFSFLFFSYFSLSILPPLGHLRENLWLSSFLFQEVEGRGKDKHQWGKIGIDSYSLEKNTCVLCLIYFNNGTVSLFFVLALLWGWERFGNCFSGEEWMRFSFSSCSNVSIWK